MKVIIALAFTLLLVPSANARTLFGACAHYGGKQCGCTASHIIFGREVSGLAAVSSWYRFPRTQCHVGAAAIWPGRHVEIVTGCNGDGTASTTGSVGFSRARNVVFVDPHGGGGPIYAANVPTRQRPVRYARRHYAVRVAYHGHYYGHRHYAALKGLYAQASSEVHGPWR